MYRNLAFVTDASLIAIVNPMAVNSPDTPDKYWPVVS